MPGTVAERIPSIRILAGLVLAALTALAAGRAWADPPGRVGRIADTQGTVWLYDDEDGEWTQARRNRPVTAGDRLSAEAGARATVQVGSGTVRIDGATEIEFTALDDRNVQLQLHDGSVALRLRSAESAREFTVATAEGRFEPTRAGRYRIDRERGGSFGAVTAGAMRFEATDSALDINAGQRAEFWSERGTTHYAWAQMADDRFGEWVAREEREDDREFARDERRRYVSPEMTGAEDLDRYGSWDSHPEYGTIWYPRAVVAGWAPYRYGQWAYVRPWGWTWVDDAPWGFAPFHYGRWVSYGGRWGWCPGTYVARPVYAPALVAWFGSGNVSVSIGVGPNVGWVPLAPREVYVPPYRVTNVYVRNVNVTHERWQPQRDRGGAVPTGPIMYTNQGVAGGVTVVSSEVLRQRQPISGAITKPVDNRTIGQWQQQAPRQLPPTAMAPPAPTPTARVQPAPGGAVPAAPGAQGRNTPWLPRAVERGGNGNNNAAANDDGDARRTRPMPPAVPLREGVGERRGEVARERVQQGDDGQRRALPMPPRVQQPAPPAPAVMAPPAPAARPVPPQVQPQRPVQVAPPAAPPRVEGPPPGRPAPQEGRGRGNDRIGDGQREAPREGQREERRRGEPREQQNR